MTLNLTELRDEPLGKHPSQAESCACLQCCGAYTEAQQDVVAADYESSFAFDVEGLGDEALDAQIPLTVSSCMWGVCGFSCLVPDKRAGS